MQRDEDKLSMPGGFKTNIANASTYSNPIDNGQNPSVTHTTSVATPMRATNVTNPYGSAFEVAGPTFGGTAKSYDGKNIEESSLSDTVKAKATTAASGAAAAGASVIAAAKKLVNHNNGNSDNGHYDVKDNVLPISNQSAIRENHDLEFSKKTSATKPLSPMDRLGPMDRLPDEDASQIPVKEPMTQYYTSVSFESVSENEITKTHC